MNVRPFIIDEALRERVQEVMTYAKNNVRDAEADDYIPPGEISEHVIETHFGYRIVYSHDFFLNHGIVRRMSISVPTAQKLPNEYVVRELAELFHFHADKCQIALTPIGEGHSCVMVVEPLE